MNVAVRLDRLEELMNKRGIGPGELAYLSGVSYAQIYKMRQGRAPNVSAVVLAKLALALGCSLDFLMGIEGANSPLPDVAPLVARLNALPEDRRQEAVNTFLSILDFSELEEDELMRDPQVRRFIELMDQLSEEQQDEAVAKLEEMVARHMNTERAARESVERRNEV